VFLPLYRLVSFPWRSVPLLLFPSFPSRAFLLASHPRSCQSPAPLSSLPPQRSQLRMRVERENVGFRFVPAYLIPYDKHIERGSERRGLFSPHSQRKALECASVRLSVRPSQGHAQSGLCMLHAACGFDQNRAAVTDTRFCAHLRRSR
jgi:hypothetical protein